MKIWKYTFDEPTMVFDMPKGAEILCAQIQVGKPCLWARIDPDAPKEHRMFQIHGTGNDLGSAKLKYIGTYQVNTEFFVPYVWHVFEVLEA